ncbi:MAG: hypothetical protein LJE63_12495 [Desulfobacteraceae bacterium]|nr:hypothetical protein [Desulfobacteraceae bacterium]
MRGQLVPGSRGAAVAGRKSAFKPVRLEAPRAMAMIGRVLLALLAALWVTAPAADAGVRVYDRVTAVGCAVFIEVETRRFGFPEGGTRVQLHLDERALGEILTGADGRGYLKYTPGAAGELRLAARWRNFQDSGRLLVLKPDEKVVVVEIDAALRSHPLDQRLREGGAAALESLSRRFRLIYLESPLGALVNEKWLTDSGLPQTVVLRNRGEATFKHLAAHGVRPFAVVGSAGLLAAAKAHVEKRFSFEKTADGETVEDWPALLEALAP